MIKSAQQSTISNDIKYNSMSAGTLPSNEYLIQTTVVGATPAASIEFDVSDYAGIYRHLKIVYTARNSSTGVDGIRVQLNGVTTSGSYKWHGLRYQNGSILAYASGTETSMEIGASPHSSDTANAFTAGVVDILDFAHSNKNTTLRALAGNYSGAINFVRLHSGLFISTATVTSIKILGLNASSFIQGSRFSVYGVTA